jgi:ATP-dependent Clp protease adaptor protein ClpS
LVETPRVLAEAGKNIKNAAEASFFVGYFSMNDYNSWTERDVSEKTREDVTEPSMYRVLLLNDDYTTMEFVVEILMRVFSKSIEEATQIMLNVHRVGVGLCGVYTYEVAETKVETVQALAKEIGFPLKCSMEKE